MDTDRIPADARKDVINRLRRAEGQLRALSRGLEDGGDCEALLRQMAAAKHAVERAGVRLLAAGLATCLADRHDGDPSTGDFEKLFLELA